MALSMEEKQRLQDLARELRLTVIDVMAWSGGAHVGGSLSIIDILTILYFKYLKIDPANPKWEDRDRFILSKGHAAAGYIPVLAKRGYFPEETLKTFNHFGSPFAMHPDCNKVIGCDASVNLPLLRRTGGFFQRKGHPCPPGEAHIIHIGLQAVRMLQCS